MKTDRVKLYDVVALLKNMPDKNLLKGQVGTAVEQLDENIFEVEFINPKGETVALEPIHTDDLFLLHFELEKA